MEAEISKELKMLISAAKNKSELEKAAIGIFQLYSALIKAGFSEDQALQIVIAQLSIGSIINTENNKGEEND